MFFPNFVHCVRGFIRKITGQNAFDFAQSTLKQAEEKYRKEGGTLFIRQEAFEKEITATQQTREEKRQEFYQLAAGPGPLGLVVDQLNEILHQALRDAPVHAVIGQSIISHI